MKKIPFIVALITLFSFSACSDGSTDTALSENQAEMASDAPAAGTVIVEAPEYTSVAEPMERNAMQLLDEYMALKEALVESDAAAAQAAASKVLNTANAMPVATLQPEQKAFAEERVAQIKQSASEIAKASNLGAQRQHLELLSEATFALTKAFGGTEQKLYYQHCPMALNDKGAYCL